jgi:hypothetical protein
MNKKLIMQLSLVFAVLLVLALSVKKMREGAEIDKKNLFPFALENVDSFQVNHFATGILFKRKEGEWQVKRVENDLTKELKEKMSDGLPEVDKDFVRANSAKVAKVLAYLLQIQVTEPVAVNTDDFATFQINPHSLHVIFYDKEGKMLDRLNVGKQGPDMFTSFVKKGNLDGIYLVEQNFQLLLQRPFEQWLFKEKKSDEKSDEKTGQEKE